MLRSGSIIAKQKPRSAGSAIDDRPPTTTRTFAVFVSITAAMPGVETLDTASSGLSRSVWMLIGWSAIAKMVSEGESRPTSIAVSAVVYSSGAAATVLIS